MTPASANRDITRTWTYHNATKHWEWSIRASPHYLDWSNQPIPLKIYTTIEAIPLPRDAEQTGIAALSAIAASSAATDMERIPRLEDLARILYFSAGITKKKLYTGGEIYFRAASCTGALYEFELYLVCSDLPELKAGVYHFGPGDFALRLLRVGDHRGVLVHATAGEPSIVHAPAIIVCAGTYWRNAWKYRTRTYRHFGWDNGTILANMLAMSAALQMPAKIVLGFVDSEVNALLDLDTSREVAFSVVSLGRLSGKTPAAARELPKLNLPTVPLSPSEVHYPELREIHEASSLQNGSSRKFERLSITLDQLLTILTTSTQPIWPGFSLLNNLYLIVNAVDGLAPGAYYYDVATADLELLKEGNFRNKASYLGLQQDLPGHAAADVFFLASLEPILNTFGNRGYRAAQLEAGILGGKMYLAAYALHLGATGLTFFDDDVTEFFSPHAAGKSAIFLMALGKGRKPDP